MSVREGERSDGGDLTHRTARTVVAPRLLLRQIEAVLVNGYATEYEESAPGVQCVAAPVFDGEQLVAAISLTGSISRFRIEPHVAALHGAARGLGGLVAAGSPRPADD